MLQSFHILDSSVPPLVHDIEFMDALDSVSRCKVPIALKTSICKAIENHSFNCRMTLSLDLSVVSTLPEILLNPFTQLMKHVSRIDTNSKELVLDILKIITEFTDDDAENSGERNSSKANSSNHSDKHLENHDSNTNNPQGAFTYVNLSFCFIVQISINLFPAFLFLIFSEIAFGCSPVAVDGDPLSDFTPRNSTSCLKKVLSVTFYFALCNKR